MTYSDQERQRAVEHAMAAPPRPHYSRSKLEEGRSLKAR